MISRRHMLVSAAVLPCLALPALSAPPAVFVRNGYAIHGVDPVAYFRKDHPVQGNDAYRLIWRNAIWRFENAANLTAFESAPLSFAPRYGGYCAMSLTQGQWSNSDPEAWAIHSDRLYLTHSIAARDRWLENPDHFAAQADFHWHAAHG
ncbi:MAG: YHS domain-containing (seleno)protein [Pseudomonadota bacterium]